MATFMKSISGFRKFPAFRHVKCFCKIPGKKFSFPLSARHRHDFIRRLTAELSVCQHACHEVAGPGSVADLAKNPATAEHLHVALRKKLYLLPGQRRRMHALQRPGPHAGRYLTRTFGPHAGLAVLYLTEYDFLESPAFSP